MLGKAAFVLFLALAGAETQGGQSGASLASTQDILREIKDVNGEKDQEAREKKTQKMGGDIFYVWKAGKIDTLDTKIISRLVPLLDDDSDAIRGWVACTLGYFGPRAKSAVPGLRAAEKRQQDDVEAAAKASGETVVIAPAYDSTACIEQALSRIQDASR